MTAGTFGVASGDAGVGAGGVLVSPCIIVVAFFSSTVGAATATVAGTGTTVEADESVGVICGDVGTVGKGVLAVVAVGFRAPVLKG